jgi:hypothetical protein
VIFLNFFGDFFNAIRDGLATGWAVIATGLDDDTGEFEYDMGGNRAGTCGWSGGREYLKN